MPRKKTTTASLIAIFIAVLMGIGLIVYRAAFSRGHIPNFPSVPINPQDAETSLQAQAKRARSFRPTDAEAELITRLEDIHLAETGEETEVPSASVERQVDAFRQSLGAVAKTDRARALLLGDYLADRFQQALEAFLAESPAAGKNQSGEMMRLIMTGGAFYMQAVQRKLINPDRTLNVSQALPTVLFFVLAACNPSNGSDAEEQNCWNQEDDDGDGYSDEEERRAGTDPLSPGSFP